MMKTLHILLVSETLLLCKAWIPNPNFPSCLTPDITWDQSNIIATELNISTPEGCQTICSSMEHCASFTWLSGLTSPASSLGCILFSQIGDTFPCDECISGPSRCPCTIRGECVEQDDNLIQAFPEIPTIAMCENLCKNSTDCTTYTYLDDSHPAFSYLCLLFNSCDTLIEECEGCITGVPDCDSCGYDWSFFEWHCYMLLDNHGQHYHDRNVCSEECVQVGGLLTSIHSLEENVFIHSLLKTIGKAGSYAQVTFIGADEVGSTEFAWLDGTVWNYENWQTGDPNGGQGCVWLGYDMYNPYQWIDGVCTTGASSSTVFDCICKI